MRWIDKAGNYVVKSIKLFFKDYGTDMNSYICKDPSTFQRKKVGELQTEKNRLRILIYYKKSFKFVFTKNTLKIMERTTIHILYISIPTFFRNHPGQLGEPRCIMEIVWGPWCDMEDTIFHDI